MAKKALHGIRVEWDFAKRDGSIHTWTANLPFGVFLRYGSWDVAGNPSADIAPVISYPLILPCRLSDLVVCQH